MKKIAVIILNWNGADLLRKFLPSVCAHTNANIADVIVVDNGSDDNSVEVLKQEFPQVKTLLFPQNYGFAAGYNKALEMLDYKYAVLLNSDVETTPHWLEPLLEFAEGNLDVAAERTKRAAPLAQKMSHISSYCPRSVSRVLKILPRQNG